MEGHQGKFLLNLLALPVQKYKILLYLYIYVYIYIICVQGHQGKCVLSLHALLVQKCKRINLLTQKRHWGRRTRGLVCALEV